MKFIYSLLLLVFCAATGQAQKYIYGGTRDSTRVIANNNNTPARQAADMVKKADSQVMKQQEHLALAIDSAVHADTVSATVKLYLSQTENEQFVKTEKGTAAFFNMPMATHNDFYFGFFDGAPKGTILKVYNPGADKTIYVKVLGNLPATKQYYHAILGISSKAKEALGTTEERVWCEVSYASGF